MIARRAKIEDAAAIAAIYNEGIEDGIATFETRLANRRRCEEVVRGRFPIVVVENSGGDVIAFASTSEYRPRDCYAGVAEFSVYVARSARGQGAGRLAMQSLIEEARARGLLETRVARVSGERREPRAASQPRVPRGWYLQTAWTIPRRLARRGHRRSPAHRILT